MLRKHSITRLRPTPFLLAVLVLLSIAWIYIPVRHASFVWDDWLDFHDTAWLREGSAWMHYVLRDFNGWTNYFRPLGVLLFAAEVRLFNATPGPMHVVSLVLHLIDTLVVYAACRRFAQRLRPGRSPGYAPLVAMTIYGLHPALIETVAWIGCQFEMLLTLFVLLGLWGAMSVASRWKRAIAVASCFFLAAGSKESAAAFPLLLVLLDWTLLSASANEPLMHRIRRLLVSSWPTYLAVTIAGFAYLAVRHAALGKLLSPQLATPLSLVGHLREVSFLYLQNWRILLWPFTGMSPIHPVDINQFQTLTIQSAIVTLVTLGVIGCALWRVLLKPPGIATVVLAATLALLPVLHIIAADFDSSLYHERYVMVALAVGCVLLPVLTPAWTAIAREHRIVPTAAGLLAVAWLALSALTIRTTLPLWAHEINLWRWAWAMYPDSEDAKANLLSAYIRSGDDGATRELIARLKADPEPCAICMLNAAVFAVRKENAEAAKHALDSIRDSREIAADPQLFAKFLLTTGEMLSIEGKTDDAASVIGSVQKLQPLDPEPTLSLAIVEAQRGNCARARQLLEQGAALIPAEERAARRIGIVNAIAASSAGKCLRDASSPSPASANQTAPASTP